MEDKKERNGGKERENGIEGKGEDRVRERFKVKLSERNIIKGEKTLNGLGE